MELLLSLQATTFSLVENNHMQMEEAVLLHLRELLIRKSVVVIKDGKCDDESEKEWKNSLNVHESEKSDKRKQEDETGNDGP